MKRYAYILVAMLGGALSGSAQEVKSMDVSEEDEYLNGMVPVASYSYDEPNAADSLHLPEVDYTGMVHTPHSWNYGYVGGYGGWNLHEGLNANLDLSAFTSFGKNHISGTAERISLLYARALSDHWSIAVGGYFANMNSNWGNYRTGGLSALVDYRFNEHWEAYVFAQKNLFNSNSISRYGPWYGMDAYDYFGNMADRIGLGVRYNFNPSTYVEVQFSWDRYPNMWPQYPAPNNRSQERAPR